MGDAPSRLTARTPPDPLRLGSLLLTLLFVRACLQIATKFTEPLRAGVAIWLTPKVARLVGRAPPLVKVAQAGAGGVVLAGTKIYTAKFNHAASFTYKAVAPASAKPR